MVAAVVLTLAYFFCKPSFFLSSTLGVALAGSSRLGRYKEFFSHSYWCIGQTLLLTAIPLWHLRRIGERPSHYRLARPPPATPPDSLDFFSSLGHPKWPAARGGQTPRRKPGSQLLRRVKVL